MAAILPGTPIGRYIIKRQLGTGGMGEVYLARDTHLDRDVALKILPAEMAADHQRMKRFIQEAKTASALNQPNILTVFEIGEADSMHFIATEFINGETLRQHMAHKRLNLTEALGIGMQVACALAAAHKAGIVHRDIKPENIMVRHDDAVVKVLDFGLAKLTEPQSTAQVDSKEPTRSRVNTDPGVVMGTVQYMSPEQARGLDVDARTDIWSLGCVLYKMVAGRLPFEGQTRSDVIVNILQKEPPALTLLSEEADERLDEIVTKALTKDKEERYQSAKDLFIDLKRMRHHLDVEAEIERTFPPELRSAKWGTRLSSEHQTVAAAQRSAARTATAEDARPTSSVEYIVAGIKRHKKAAILILAFLTIAVAASILFIHFRGARTLTEKDTILLTDFVNTTEDQVFDVMLKQALSEKLSQSPFLNIFSEGSVGEALNFMGRSKDERVTRDVGREICQRQGLKAMLVGSIAPLGNHYVITLEAVNGQTSDLIASEQAEAENKEQVLHALDEAATKLREKLGESLASIQKFDTPIEQATTSSLEAFKAYSLGVEQHLLKGDYHEAIKFYRRATEIDHNFASAYARLSAVYYNSEQYDLAREASQKAYDLSDRVSPREKLYITASYYSNVTGEVEKNIETLEVWKRTYPREFVPPNNLALQYNSLGQYEKAVEEAREAIGLNPNYASAHSNLATALLGLNRLDEAKEVIEQALAQKIETVWMHRTLYLIAFMQSDEAAMKQQVKWASDKSYEYYAQSWQAETAAFSGQPRKAKEFSSRAADSARIHNLEEVAALIDAGDVERDALFGDCQQVKAQTAKVLAETQNQTAQRIAVDSLAACGELSQIQEITSEMLKRYSKDSLLDKVYLPMIQARVEMRRDNPAKAIQSLEATRPYEGTAPFQIAYLRGQAYLVQKKATEAAAEFQKIFDHRSWQPASPLYPLAQLGLARAAALNGDTARRARQAYQNFFALWKDAEQDTPLLQQARQEYEKLK